MLNEFDLNDSDIKLKYNHSKRVMEINELYANKLGFNKKEILIAK